ncbi:MAG: PKD domain-containing protein [Chitinophagaceae bacterium]
MFNALMRVFYRCAGFVLILFYVPAAAQLKADFTSTSPTGCSPLLVNFTDVSTGVPVSWRWDLGNGTISTLKNPTATYFNPGTYNVKLVVKNASGSDSVTRQQFITVYPKPVVDFVASDSTGCFPYIVNFTDRSSAGSGTITETAWDFGDGTTSTGLNPSHIYTSAGTFTVSLKVTNSNGCATVFTRKQYITVTSGVTASFTNTTAVTCEASPQIKFTNTSTGPGSLGYEWNFGDGGVSAVKDPVHTYTVAGSYTVSLIVISPQGCRDTITKTNLISFGKLSSSFSSPDSICVSAVFSLVNNSTPVPADMTWDFGDGTSSTLGSPVKSYITPGVYRIRLINNFGACLDTVFRNITVNQKTQASFTASAVVSCQVPFTVKFKPTASGIFTTEWDFGDGSASSQAEPSHTYTQAGIFDVRLILINSLGCPDTVTRKQYITIEEPSIQLTGFPQTGCIPLTIRPSAIVSANEAIASYLWTFGDGSTSTAANPVYTYTSAGTYTVSLTVTTVGGCRKTLNVPAAVRAGSKPDAAFEVRPNDVCASQMVQFTDSSKGKVDQWLWNFGDGGVSSAQHPSYTYTDTGYFSVTLIVWSNTCADTIRLKDIVHIKPPIAAFLTQNDCAQPFRKTFLDQSIGAKTWYWTFGDGGSSTTQHPVHNYSSKGTYVVTLVVTNGSCTNIKTRTVLVVNEDAVITANRTVICKDGVVRFNSGSMNPAQIQSWLWEFNDSTLPSTSVGTTDHLFTKTGSYRAKLTTRDLLGCIDTASIAIRVYGPAAAFSNAASSSCLGAGPVSFIDQSVTDGTNPIIKYRWVYGDGLTDSSVSGPFLHNYTATGSYLVSLTVTDAFGCSSSITKTQPVIISKPTANFYSPDTNTCINKPVSLMNTSVGTELTYSWKLGDGSVSTDINPVHQYLATGFYSVTLVTTDKYGCTDSLVKSNYINISLPVAGFTISDSFSSCPPLKVIFTNTATNFRSVRWDFGDGNTSVLTDPIHTYTFPGTYIAKHTVAGPGGCEDVFTRRIVVKGPTGTFDYTPKIGCNPLTVTFTATTQNRSSFLWDFTDGSTQLTNDSIVTHTYTTSGDFIPRMILTDAAGCNVPLEGRDTIHVVGIRVDFESDIKNVCDKGFVVFTNNTVSNDYIRSWSWNFGDGSTSTVQHPTHYYSVTGIYKVVLTATSSSGCIDSLVKESAIRVTNRPLINITGDTENCLPATAVFNGNITRGVSSGLVWNWGFGNGNTSNQQNPAPQVYIVAADYQVTAIVTDSNTCRDTATHLFVAHPLPVTNAGADAVYCLGTPVQLRVTGAMGYTWLNPTGLSCSDCDGPLAAPEQNITYLVEGKNQFGCVARDSVYVKVRRPFTINVSPDDTLCLGSSTKLLAIGADLYTWTPSAGLSGTTIANPVASPANTTTYVVTGRDSDGCFTDKTDVRITVYPIPTVTLGEDVTMPAGGSVQLKAVASPDVTSYAWSPAFQISCTSCPDPVVSPRKTMEYSVRVNNEGGCIADDKLRVLVTCNNGNLFIPNSFSPNGNGMNERFYPRGTGIYLVKSFRIFNRWGQVIFEAQNFNVNDAAYGWDGTFKGRPVSPDVFIYTCDVVCQNDEIIQYKGDVSLLR